MKNNPWRSISAIYTCIYLFMFQSPVDDTAECISRHLCRLLDFLGYSQQMRETRIASYREEDAIRNADEDNVTYVTAGSKGEGLTKPWESDTDTLFLFKNVACVENGSADIVPEDKTILKFNTEYEHPGYNILTLHGSGPQEPIVVSSSLKPLPTGETILSSDAFIECIAEDTRANAANCVEVHGRSGPASSVTVERVALDNVYSIPVISTSILAKWLDRPRKYDWPPPELRQEIARLRGNFVAKGCKRSEREADEWRICFNEAELLLIHSLEDVLIKTYVLLKIILKELLRPIDEERTVTSYVMKNIVFWLAENNTKDLFQDKNLLKLLLKALHMLQRSLEGEPFLPSYMIPERNVFGGKMTEDVRDNLVAAVKCMIQEGPCLLLRLQKLDFTMGMDYGGLKEFSAKRDELETLHLTRYNYGVRLKKQGMSLEDRKRDRTYRVKTSREIRLLNSKWPQHIERKLKGSKDPVDRLSVILK